MLRCHVARGVAGHRLVLARFFHVSHTHKDEQRPWDRRTAFLYERLPKHNVRCVCCRQSCLIRPGETGICGVRFNDGGELKLLVHSRVCSVNVDPIEKKPLYHFLPGTQIMSVGTVGCNFSCSFCQNWQISQVTKDIKKRLQEEGTPELAGMEVGRYGYHVPPDELVRITLEQNIPSIAFTYNEPAIFAEYAYDTIRIARKHHMKSIYVTNGYESAETMKVLGPWIDAMNIDLKSFRNTFYRNLSKARLDPVLDTIRMAHHMGIHIELTTLVIPRENDSTEELRDIARFIYNVSPSIPWHVSAFHPDFKMRTTAATPASTIGRAIAIGKEEGLQFVYAGNLRGNDWSSTYCPVCNEVLVSRRWMGATTVQNMNNGTCGQCGYSIYGVWSSESVRPLPTDDVEEGFPRDSTGRPS